MAQRAGAAEVRQEEALQTPHELLFVQLHSCMSSSSLPQTSYCKGFPMGYGLGSTPCCFSHPLTFYHTVLLVFLSSKLSSLDSLLLLSDLVQMLSPIGSPPKSSQAGEVPFPVLPGILCVHLSHCPSTPLLVICVFSPHRTLRHLEQCHFLSVPPSWRPSTEQLTNKHSLNE